MLHHIGPLRGEVGHQQPLRRADDLAVHHPGRERVGGTGHEEGTDLVEEFESDIEIAGEDRQASAARPPDHHGGRDIEALAQFDCGIGVHTRLVHRPTHEALVRPHHGDHRPHRMVPGSLEMAFGASQPPAHRRHQPGVHHQVHRDHRGDPTRLDALASADAQRMQVLPCLDAALEVAGTVRGFGSHLENVGRAARVLGQLERSLPVAPSDGGPSCLDVHLQWVRGHVPL